MRVSKDLKPKPTKKKKKKNNKKGMMASIVRANLDWGRWTP